MISLLNRARLFKTKKSLGQNFLVSEEFLNKIVNSISDTSQGKRILEIGPGIGFLTEILLNKGMSVNAIDLDEQAIKQITKNPKLHIQKADALHFDFNSLEKPFSVIGNLPFNVGTKILLRFIGELNEPNWAISGIDEMILMFQYEVAERLTAKPGCKAYNPLSILIQSKSEVEFLFKVPAKWFYPIPKVDAGVIRLKPLAQNRLQELNQAELDNLSRIVKQGFSTRRKNLKNSLKGLFSGEELISLNICPELRAESLSLSQYISLAKNYSQKI